MAKKLTIAVGTRYGRLAVIDQLGVMKGRTSFLCRCDCGQTVERNGTELQRGKSRQCDRCALAERGRGHVKHDSCHSPEYRSWSAMLTRCRNPNNPAYPRYGGKGIKVHPPWQSSFKEFLAYMGKRPTLKHTLDRWPDRNGNYEPGNVRWATATEQTENRSCTRYCTVKGENRTIAEWSRRSGLKWKTICARLDSGWDPEDAVSLRPISSLRKQ